MGKEVSNQALETLFLNARTYNTWSDRLVDDEILQQAYDVAKMGPTSANCCPLRILLIKSPEAKAKLKPCLSPGNVDKTMAAPITAILAYDMQFYEKLDILSPAWDAKSLFLSAPDKLEENAFRNSTLQAAYFFIAARAVGLDCGPMTGFNAAMVDEVFLSETTYKSNILCNLGYGTAEGLYPRAPRLDFNTACKIL